MSARTEAAGAGMSVGDSLQVVKVAIGLLRSDGYVVMPDKLEAALATLQARLLAADELREAAAECVEAWKVGANSADATECGHIAIHHRIKLAKDRLAAALAAYDKAGTNEH